MKQLGPIPVKNSRSHDGVREPLVVHGDGDDSTPVDDDGLDDDYDGDDNDDKSN